MAAGPVSRILSAGKLPLAGDHVPQDGHSSRPRIATRLKRPTRRFGAPSRHAPGPELSLRKPGFLPIWSCSVWGLPCPLHCWNGGALLPHLFTLTLTLLPGRYVFCGTFRQPLLKAVSRTLSGTLLCGVRTFLSPRPERRRERPSGPATYIAIICDEPCARSNVRAKTTLRWTSTGEDARASTLRSLGPRHGRPRPCDQFPCYKFRS